MAHYVKVCYPDSLTKSNCLNLVGATLEEFLNCKHNLANNRQTRMLANFNTLGCGVMKCVYQTGSCSQKMKQLSEMKLLESAKHTLISLAFFGLAEYPIQSEYLFLKTFNEKKFRFVRPIKNKTETTAKFLLQNEQIFKHVKKIELNNYLDIKLYEFAKDIFFKKVNFFKTTVF